MRAILCSVAEFNFMYSSIYKLLLHSPNPDWRWVLFLCAGELLQGTQHALSRQQFTEVSSHAPRLLSNTRLNSRSWAKS